MQAASTSPAGASLAAVSCSPRSRQTATQGETPTGAVELEDGYVCAACLAEFNADEQAALLKSGRIVERDTLYCSAHCTECGERLGDRHDWHFKRCQVVGCDEEWCP